EIVPIEDDEVGVVPDLDGAEVVLSDEPLVRDSREPQRLLPRQGLPLIDQIATQILASDDRVEVEPRVDNGDVAAVGVVADVNPAVEDRPVRRGDPAAPPPPRPPPPPPPPQRPPPCLFIQHGRTAAGRPRA